MISIRQIQPDEISGINSRYEEISFKLSDPAHEYIVIAEEDGIPAGQGRLVKLNAHEAELGGMYVYPAFRGKGIAEKIVQHLLDQSHGFRTIYCLPFQHLEKFYKSFGFVESQGESNPEIKQKYEWCLKQYEVRTLLLEIRRPS